MIKISQKEKHHIMTYIGVIVGVDLPFLRNLGLIPLLIKS